MFTGIVEELGTVQKIQTCDDSATGGHGFSLVIGNVPNILEDCHIGDSIAVNGVCLTVTEFDDNKFKVGIAPETLQRTNIRKLERGDNVNLERAVAGHTRFGGHFVQGHIDTVAELVRLLEDGNTLRLYLKPRDSKVLQYIVEKGFVAIDGTSLTVTTVDDAKGTFSVMLIAHTQQNVTLSQNREGDLLNIEVDLMGKLVEKQVDALARKSLKLS